MKYSLTLLSVLTCVLGHNLVHSFNFDLSQAVNQIRKGVQINAAKPYLQTARHLLPAYVRKFQQSPIAKKAVSNIDRQRSAFSSLLLHGAPIPIKDFSKLSAPFKFEKCNTSEQQTMEIKSLSVKPYPVHFPGEISFSLEVEFHETISNLENVTIALEVYAEAGGKWIELPCLEQIGSCTYEDFCQLIAGNACPQQFKQQGVPCKCPFDKGTYKLNDFSVEILAEVLLPDNYKAKVQVSSDAKKNIACYNFELTEN